MTEPFDATDLVLNAIVDDFAERTEGYYGYAVEILPDNAGWLVATTSPSGTVIARAVHASLTTAIIAASTRTLEEINEVESAIENMTAASDEEDEETP